MTGVGLAQEYLLLAAVFASFVMFGVAILMIVRKDAGTDRMKRVAQSKHNTAAQGSETVSLFFEDDRPRALKILEPIQRRLAQSDPNQVSAARARLVEAGYYRKSAVETYFTMRIVLGVGFACAWAFYILMAPPEWSGTTKIFTVVLAAALGYYLPALFVTARIDSRRRQFKLGMPDALDMMLVGVEAGLSLSAAMKHIVKEFAMAHPVVAEQFQIVTLEFQAGRSRSEALEGLARRMNLQVTRTLAAMIVQSEALGTSMAQTLQVMAQELRVQRMLEAEKKAAELPVKMSVPLVLCIFPALMAVALVPAMLNTLDFFANLTN